MSAAQTRGSGSMPRSDLATVLGPVVEEIGDLLAVVESAGVTYARDYLKHVTENAPRPSTPQGLHVKVAAALRDIVLEHAVAVRAAAPRFV